MRVRLHLTISLLFLLVCVGSVRADISRSQARRIIARMAGFNLPDSAVNVTSVNSTAADAAEASADLQLVFRLVQNEDGIWSIAEIRTAQDLWEDVHLLAGVANFKVRTPECQTPTMTWRRDMELDSRRVRCLVANLFSINLPSDEVRVKEFSPLSVPLGTETSALAVVYVRADFRLRRQAKSWQVTEFKSGNREWINVAGIQGAIDAAKRNQAENELRLIAAALQGYKQDRGRYVTTDKHLVLIDHLHPRFLIRVLRLDPWHHPYHYQGDSQRFALRSAGPDGIPDTADDITVSN